MKRGCLKVGRRIRVVGVGGEIGKGVVVWIGLKDRVVVGNGIGVGLEVVVMGKCWVKGGNWLLVGVC